MAAAALFCAAMHSALTRCRSLTRWLRWTTSSVARLVAARCVCSPMLFSSFSSLSRPTLSAWKMGSLLM